ncbi:MAG: glycosyltransferase family 4 protein [Bacteroidales bacterium]|nr:glycosyltransferase family 4 protein [Bacteroidales bacterium]
MNNSFQRKVKIAFLGNQIAYGGGAKSLLLLIKSLQGQNIESYLFVTQISSEEMKAEFEEYVEFVKIVNLPEAVSAQTQTIKENVQKRKENNQDLLNIKIFAEELNKLEIDILHINNSVFAPIYKILRSTTNIKIVTHIREWVDWNGIHQKQRYIIDSIENNSDALICISDTEARVFKAHTNLHVIPNTFDFNELTHIGNNGKKIRKKLGINENTFVVGMMGSFQRNKGVLDFLKALAYLKQNKNNFEDIKFVVLGGSVNVKPNIIKHILRKILLRNTFNYQVYKLLKREKILNEVIFLSNRKNVLEVVNSFDVAVRPSYTGDPWGRDVIEFMAMKKPIVATGTSEFFIKNEKTGFIVPPRDYVGLAEKIYWLYQHNKERNEMGQRAYKNIFELSNTNVFRANLIDVYFNLIRHKLYPRI